MGRSRCAKGFTLIEFVIVMVMFAILAAVVALRLTAQTRHAVVGAADELRRNLSHVQALALGWGVRLRVSVEANGSSYSVTCRTALGRAPCNAVGNAVTDPATGQTFTVVLAANVSLLPVSSTLDFDSLGRPVSSGTTLVATNPAVTYTLSGGGRTATVAVQPVTGFALASY